MAQGLFEEFQKPNPSLGTQLQWRNLGGFFISVERHLESFRAVECCVLFTVLTGNGIQKINRFSRTVGFAKK